MRAEPKNKERKARQPFSPELMAKYDKAMMELEQSLKKTNQRGSGWRRLLGHQSRRGGDHFVRRLDAQYTLKVEMLYADLN